MNFFTLAVLVLTFAAPAAALLFTAWRGSRVAGAEARACLALFAVGALAAVAGIARLDRPVRVEFLWPLTLEQSGYFEFALQLVWSRFAWILYSAGLLLAYVIYDAPPSSGRARGGYLFLIGAYAGLVLASLSENTLLSFLFVEVSVFLTHAFRAEDPEEADAERASYFKRSVFVFLGLAALLGLALSRQLSSSSVGLMGAVLYLFATVVSRHNPARWSQLPLFLLQVGAALFLLERVMAEDISPELWLPLAGVFAVGTAVFACLSLISPAPLGASFWLLCTFLGYLLFLRFSSAKPADAFWGAHEVLGLGAAFAIVTLLRFGDRLDAIGKRVLAFAALAVTLGVLTGGMPSVETLNLRFDADTSLVRIGALGLLSFLVAAMAARALAFSVARGGPGSARALAGVFGPLALVLLAHGAMLLRWTELSLEELGAAGLLSDPRALLVGAALGAGLLCGGLLGTNGGFAAWTKKRDPRMEDLFPSVDPALLSAALRAARLPVEGVEWLSGRMSGVMGDAAGAMESLDRGFFGERFFRRVASGTASLSQITRHIHSGQARAYLFLGVLVTLLSSLAFLWEGR